MPKVYIASKGEHVEFERVCSNCSHQWTASFNVRVSSELASTRQAAGSSAQAAMHEEKKDRLENCEVLCPECSHFSTDAMRRHFFNGYAKGILKRYKHIVWVSLGEGLAVVWIPILLILFANLNPLNSAYPARSVLWLLLFIYFGGMAVSKWLAFFWGISSLAAVQSKLIQLSDEQLRELAIACYKANKNSLKASGFDNIYVWNAWFRKPLFYKSAAPITEQVTQ